MTAFSMMVASSSPLTSFAYRCVATSARKFVTIERNSYLSTFTLLPVIHHKRTQISRRLAPKNIGKTYPGEPPYSVSFPVAKKGAPQNLPVILVEGIPALGDSFVEETWTFHAVSGESAGFTKEDILLV
jgi:hypothetical protein